jgi:hypothetical protein
VGRRLITQAEWAKSHGFSRQYVQKLLKQGKISLKDGKVDPFDADRRLAAFRDPIQHAVKGPKRAETGQNRAGRRYEGDDDLDAGNDDGVDDTTGLREDELPSSSLPDQLLRARIKKEREDGLLKEMERKKRQGELVDAEEVRSSVQARALAEREAQLAWPRRVSADMAAELGVDERLLLAILQKYVRQHLLERSQRSGQTRLGDNADAA